MMDFKPLWKLLIDREMDRHELAREAGITNATMTRMKQKKNVSVNTRLRISQAMQVKMEDLFIYIDDDK